MRFGMAMAAACAVLMAVTFVWAPRVCAGETASSNPGDALLGTWWTDGRTARVEITKYEVVKDGKKTGEWRYRGKICWLKEPNYEPGHAEAGQPKRDAKNPDASLRDRKILGLAMLDKFKYDGEKTWNEGTIYDPKSGKTYNCQITLVEPEPPANPDAPKDPVKLNVRGYVGIPMFGRTTVWTRYTAPEEGEEERAQG